MGLIGNLICSCAQVWAKLGIVMIALALGIATGLNWELGCDGAIGIFLVTGSLGIASWG